MSNLTPTPGWDDIPQFETTTPVLGGPGGPMNSQAQALLNRTELLAQEKASLSAMAAQSGAGLMGFDDAELYDDGTVGWAVRSADFGFSVLRLVPVSEWAGIAAGTSAYDIAPALNQALSEHKVVRLPARGAVDFGQKIIMPDDSRIIGPGGRQFTMRKKFNGAAFDMASNTQVSGFYVDGGNGTYTGNAIEMTTGNNQCGFDVSFEKFNGYILNYSVAGVGKNSRWLWCNFIRTNASDPHVHMEVDGTAASRYFYQTTFGGGVFCDGNGNDTFLSGCFIRKLGTNANSQLFFVTNCRFALLGGTETILGGGHVIGLNSMAGTIILGAGATGITIFPNESADVIEDSAVGNYNSFNYRPKSITPTWTQPSGTQPSLGNGTFVGTASREGMVCDVSLRLTMGSTTTFGNNTTGYRFGVPHKAAQAAVNKQFGVAYITRGSTTTVHKAEIAPGENTITLNNMAGGSVNSSTVAWAAGDTVEIKMSYQCL